MPRPLSEQVIVITGASSGIGRETAKRLAAKGAKVVVSARSEDSLDDLVSEIKGEGGEAVSLPADVSDMKEVQALAKHTMTLYGRIDTWVNNAGVLIVGDFDDTDIDEARRLFNVNFWGELHGIRAALPIMKKQHAGTIINVTSVTAKRPLPLMSIYSASKAALNGLSEALQAELKGTGVEICVVMPATIDTPLYEHAHSKEGVEAQPAPPVYPPSEVASAIEQCAIKPRHHMYAGPAGQIMALSNYMMPAVNDMLLSRITRPLLLSNTPKQPGRDNLSHPADPETNTDTGGWGSDKQKVIGMVSRVAFGVGAMLLVRRLAKR